MPETSARKQPAKKAVTKRTSKTASGNKAPAKRVVRKTAMRAMAQVTSTSTPASVPAAIRKAPTPLAASAADRSRARFYTVVAAVIFLIVIGVSAAIGFSDHGAIVVSEQFEKRLQAADAQERQVIENIALPKPTKNEVPLGGLVGTGKSPTPQPAPVPGPVATSTDVTASSSDSAAAAETETADATEAADSAAEPTE